MIWISCSALLTLNSPTSTYSAPYTQLLNYLTHSMNIKSNKPHTRSQCLSGTSLTLHTTREFSSPLQHQASRPQYKYALPPPGTPSGAPSSTISIPAITHSPPGIPSTSAPHPPSKIPPSCSFSIPTSPLSGTILTAPQTQFSSALPQPISPNFCGPPLAALTVS